MSQQSADLPQFPAQLNGNLGPPGSESRYTIIKLIGRGSFGMACLVQDASGNQYCAKVMDTNKMNAKDRGFAISEVQCLGKCSHPNIIQLYETVNVDGVIMLVMEYADGGDLHKQIKSRAHSNKPFKEHEIMFILVQLLFALEHIHAKKMMHRDLKTANVMLTMCGLIKLGDFGFCRQYDDSLSNPVGNTFCGTPYYLSPELWKRSRYSKKTDMWALGVVLYEVMSLRRPFSGKNMQDLVTNIVNGIFDPLSEQYSAPLRELCTSLLRLNPRDRPSIADVFRMQIVQDSVTTLRRSVEHHVKINPDTIKCLLENIDEVMSKASKGGEGDGTQLTALRGILWVHAEQGWTPVTLNLDPQLEVSLATAPTDGTAPQVYETIPLDTLTSVSVIDPKMAGEDNVFGVITQSYQTFWFKAGSGDEMRQWVDALKDAMGYD